MRFLNYEGLGYLIEELKSKFVQQESGKTLTTNDFTDLLKSKVEGVESGAEINKVNSVNSKEGDVVITSDDIEFLSSVSGSTPATVRDIIDEIMSHDKAQDVSIGKKADKTSVYTKGEIDTKIGNIDSGVTAVNGKVGAVTLNADDISDTNTNNKFVTVEDKTLWGNKAEVGYVDTKLNKKVDKAQGKQLSTNDFTNMLKTKLEDIENGAQVNKIELIRKNGVNIPVDGRIVNIEVPTKIGELTNDVSYQTEAQVQSLIADQGKLKKEIVSVLPIATGADDNTLYLVRNKQGTGYEEWMVINNQWEILGDTAAVDFTGYVHEDDIQTISNTDIDEFLNV